MTFTVIDVDQRSDAWFAARVGRATGSHAADIVATLKSGGEPAARRDYRLQLCCERLTGRQQDDVYVNGDMRRGVELEPEAFAAYEAETGTLVRRTGFLSADDLMIGASVDGDVDNFDGLIEIKAPRAATHLKYLRAGSVPQEYLPQILHGQLVSGARWTDFVSYSPQFPEPLRLFIVRVTRNEAAVAAYERAVRQFLDELEAEYQSVTARMAQHEAVA